MASFFDNAFGIHQLYSTPKPAQRLPSQRLIDEPLKNTLGLVFYGGILEILSVGNLIANNFMAKKIKMKLNKEFAIQTAQYKALSEKIDELMCLKLSYLLRTQLLHIFSHYLDYSYIMMEGFIKSLPSSNTQNFEQLKLRSCFAYASGFYSVARVCISIIQEFFIGLTLVLSETDELYKKIQQHRKKNRPNIRGIIETRDFISAHPFDLKRSSRTIGFGHSVNPGGILGIQMFDSTEWLTISDKDIETYLNNNKKKIDPQKDLKEFFEYCTESLNLLHEVWAEYRMENWAKNMGKQFKE